MRKAGWILTIIGTLVGIANFVIGFLFAGQAVQYAATCAMSLVFGALPFFLATALDRLTDIDRERGWKGKA